MRGCEHRWNRCDYHYAVFSEFKGELIHGKSAGWTEERSKDKVVLSRREFIIAVELGFLGSWGSLSAGNDQPTKKGSQKYLSK